MTEYGKDGIRSNCIAPGMVLTEGAAKNMSQEQLDGLLATIASSRHGKAEDIAAAAAFLLSDDAAWVTGQTLRVNGGSTYN